MQEQAKFAYLAYFFCFALFTANNIVWAFLPGWRQTWIAEKKVLCLEKANAIIERILVQALETLMPVCAAHLTAFYIWAILTDFAVREAESRLTPLANAFHIAVIAVLVIDLIYGETVVQRFLAGKNRGGLVAFQLFSAVSIYLWIAVLGFHGPMVRKRQVEELT